MTPFEIRLELLRMARDLLVDDFKSQKQSLVENWQQQVESAKVAGTASPEYPVLPQFPTEDKIVTKADTLNQFVSQTQPQPQPEIKIIKKTNS
jgi:hypothetical protein